MAILTELPTIKLPCADPQTSAILLLVKIADKRKISLSSIQFLYCQNCCPSSKKHQKGQEEKEMDVGAQLEVTESSQYSLMIGLIAQC